MKLFNITEKIVIENEKTNVYSILLTKLSFDVTSSPIVSKSEETSDRKLDTPDAATPDNTSFIVTIRLSTNILEVQPQTSRSASGIDPSPSDNHGKEACIFCLRLASFCMKSYLFELCMNHVHCIVLTIAV